MSKKKRTQAEAVAVPSKIYDFCSKKKMILGIFIGVIVVLLVGLIARGVNFAIEFKGGTMLTYSYSGDVDTNAVKDTVKGVVNSNVNVRRGESLDDGGNQLIISFTSNEGLTVDRQTELTNALRTAFPDNAIELYDSNDVNPSSGREFLLKCMVAVIFAAVVIIIYIAFRFRNIGGWLAGLSSVVALLHDVLVAITTSVILGFEFNSNTVAVILTILGYSINNTIVIYDRIRENHALMPKAGLHEVINLSNTQSLKRSIRTSITTVSTMFIITVVVLVTGYDSLLTFSVPLMMGLISGTYTSIFVAPVTWQWWMGKKSAKAKKA